MAIDENDSWNLALIESAVLRTLEFPLLSDLKKCLPPKYMITRQDVNLLVRLNWCVSIYGNRSTMDNILKWFDRLSTEETSILYEKIHCDPYELFIDAWWIDRNINILVSDEIEKWEK